MLLQMAQFTMNRYEVLRLYDLEEKLHLLLAGMTRDVDRSDRIINHFSAALKQTVDGAMYHLLVARYRMR